MFYQESQISSFFTCKRCNRKYDDTNLPKYLPCGHTMCHSCEDLLRKNITSMKCTVCSAEHCLTEGIQLPNCQVLMEMLSLKANEIYRSNDVEELKQHINEINKNVDLINQTLNGSIEKIKEHCVELRNQVQLVTELKIQKLNDLNEATIKAIDEYEKECCAKFMSDESFQKTTISNQLVQSKEFTAKWSSYLSQFKIDEQKVKQKNEKARLLLDNLKESLNGLKDFIFNDHILEFEPNCQELNKSNFGFLSNDIIMDSIILSIKQKFFLQSLFTDSSISRKWSLLYRGTRDGLSSRDFHSKCDSSFKLLVVIKTDKNEILGGYTDLNWSRDQLNDDMDDCGNYKKSDRNAFIFKYNKINDKFNKHSYLNDDYALYCSLYYGPCFGSSDIWFDDDDYVYLYDKSKFDSITPGTDSMIYFCMSEIEVFFNNSD